MTQFQMYFHLFTMLLLVIQWKSVWQQPRRSVRRAAQSTGGHLCVCTELHTVKVRSPSSPSDEYRFEYQMTVTKVREVVSNQLAFPLEKTEFS